MKRFNTISELNTNNNSLYCYIPPFNHKTKHPITSSNQIETKSGVIVFDYSNDKLCGIEIVEADKHVDMKGLGINE